MNSYTINNVSEEEFKSLLKRAMRTLNKKNSYRKQTGEDGVTNFKCNIGKQKCEIQTNVDSEGITTLSFKPGKSRKVSKDLCEKIMAYHVGDKPNIIKQVEEVIEDKIEVRVEEEIKDKIEDNTSTEDAVKSELEHQFPYAYRFFDNRLKCLIPAVFETGINDCVKKYDLRLLMILTEYYIGQVFKIEYSVRLPRTLKELIVYDEFGRKYLVANISDKLDSEIVNTQLCKLLDSTLSINKYILYGKSYDLNNVDMSSENRAKYYKDSIANIEQLAKSIYFCKEIAS